MKWIKEKGRRIRRLYKKYKEIDQERKNEKCIDVYELNLVVVHSMNEQQKTKKNKSGNDKEDWKHITNIKYRIYKKNNQLKIRNNRSLYQ